jgi:L-seryl-tRNA(Ser) seleniumtransferase
MACTPVAELRERATQVRDSAGVGEVVDTDALPGAGSLPGVTIPSAGVAVVGDHLPALRAAEPPVVARVRDGRTILDLRSVEPTDDVRLAAALRVAWELARCG